MAYSVLILLFPLMWFSNCYPSEVWLDSRYLREDDTSTSNSSNLSLYCTKPGLQCKDCQTLILCRTIEGNYTATNVETCASPNTCDEGVCTSVPNAQCTKQQFECQTVEGMYPDPASCKKFHYCVRNNGNLLHYESECEDDGYYYNPLTTYCDKKLLVNNTCPVSSIPRCVKLAQSGALKENPTIFYTCLPTKNQELYPFLDACKHGKKYDSATYSCK